MAADERVVVEFDQHSPEYRETYPAQAHELREQCPVAWSTKHDGFWVVTGHEELSALSKRADLLSNDHDPDGERNGYQGISIPERGHDARRLHRDGPARAVGVPAGPQPVPLARRPSCEWHPLIADFTRACIDDVIETGRLDFVDDFANVVPAVLTMAMLGLPLADWEIYCEPAHMQVYTPPDSPDFDRMIETTLPHGRTAGRVRADPQDRAAARHDHRAAQRQGDGRVPARRRHHRHGHAAHRRRLRHHDVAARRRRSTGSTRAPDERVRLVDDARLPRTLATEEFLRHFTPAQGGGRTVTQDCEVAGFEFSAGDRMFLSYAMCNHDPASFPNPDEIVLDRFPNPHAAFGLGVHRCIGSNLARLDFKYMLREALRRMPDYRIDHAGKEQYESIGTINGYKHLPGDVHARPPRRPAPRRGHGDVAGEARRRTRAREPPRAQGATDGPRRREPRALPGPHALQHGRARLFQLRDEDGHAYVVVDELTPEQVPLARKAELGCPERAITVEE